MLKRLSKYVFQSVASMMGQSVYILADTFFISVSSGADGLAVLNLILPVFGMMFAIGSMIGIGSATRYGINRAKGEEADHYFTQSLSWAILFSVPFMLVGIFFPDKFLALLGADAGLIELGRTYLRIILIFAPFFMCNYSVTAFARNDYATSTVMAGSLAGSAFNIVFDYIFMFPMGLGFSGAALATGIGQIVTLNIYLVVYFSRPLPVHIRRCYLKPHGATDKKLYAIGVPAILNLALPSLLVSFLNALLAGFSQSYVVVLGIYYKLQTFLYLPANGIIQGMRPIIGYNYGAREMKRVKKIYDTTLAMTAAMMLAGTLGCLFAAKPLIALFTANPETIALGTRALHIICLGFIVSAVSVTASGALEGLGKGFSSFIISLLRYVAVIIPAAFILCHTAGPSFVWHAFWITEALTAVVAAFVYRQASK